MEATQDAIRLLRDLDGQAASGSMAVFLKLRHAEDALNRSMARMLADDDTDDGR